MIRTPLPANTSSNPEVNLLSRSRIRNLNWPARSPRSMRRLRACWAVHAPVGWVCGDAQDVHAAGLEIHQEEQVEEQRAGIVCAGAMVEGPWWWVVWVV